VSTHFASNYGEYDSTRNEVRTCAIIRTVECLPDKPIAPATNEAALQRPLPPAIAGASSALEQRETPLPATLSEADEGEPDPANPPESGGDESRSGSSVAVSAEERESILAVWERLHTNGNPPSRRAVCREVFHGATGNPSYRKVQTVPDEVGE
jgi:hypothetical protein